MAKYSKTGKVNGLTAHVCRILETLDNVIEVEVKAFGVRKGVRRVEIPDRWKPCRLELVVHDERAQCIVVATSKAGAIRRILFKRLLQQGFPVAA